MKTLVLSTISFLMMYGPIQGQVEKDSVLHRHAKESTMKYTIPASIKEEHDELHKNLESFTKLPGKTGMAAKEVANMLHPHFIKEEEFALPPLGLLVSLAKGQVSGDMKGAIAMTDKLKEDWHQMLNEHQQIVGSLEKLRIAAIEEQHPEVIRFTESLKLHAKTEEEVTYPTAILIGEYLKLKLKH